MTYAVQLTPPGTGAISVILLAGAGAPGILARVTCTMADSELDGRHQKLPQLGRAARITLCNPESLSPETEDSKRVLDDALLVHAAADRFELQLHGGTAVTAAVLAALQAAGAIVLTLPQAAAEGLLGPSIEAEVQLAMGAAVTPTALRLLAAQPAALREWCRRRLSETADAMRDAARRLLARSGVLGRLLVPPRVAIIGPPNAGKSTLANALLGRPMSITSDIPGTTRDWVDGHALFTGRQGGFPEALQVRVHLVDTAGIRETEDVLESASIDRTHGQAAEADLLILLVDAAQVDSAETRALLARYQSRRHVVACNKVDAIPQSALPRDEAGVIPISALQRVNLEGLMAQCLQKLGLDTLGPAEPFAFSERQRAILEQISETEDPATCIGLVHSLSGD